VASQAVVRFCGQVLNREWFGFDAAQPHYGADLAINLFAFRQQHYWLGCIKTSYKQKKSFF
jgi:hypothetical protein